MNISEDTFAFWSQGPAATESDKCFNAESVIKKAIDADETLSSLDISVFAQGSYKARTNIRQESDVDICVRYNTSFFPEYPKGTTKQTFGNVDSELAYADFKNMVERALKTRFGNAGVTRGNKAFDVHANTYRIDADVVPAFGHRRYTGKKYADGRWVFHAGVAFSPDSGGVIKNWPEQNYANGVSRNDDTGRAYKRAIRIMKRLQCKMTADGVSAAEGIASFLVECLIWNLEPTAYQHATYTEDVRQIIIDVWNATKTEEGCTNWVEVNRLKWLFRPTQAWTREQVHAFMQAAWNYIGFK
ncbi:MAG: nucleotidyltransferase [Nitrospira sp. LK265]|nr:nucleotidyltransferase [Nitrospira sp. LK265]